MKDSGRKDSKIFTFIAALYLCVPAVNRIGVTLFPVLAGRLMTLLYLLCGTILLVYTVLDIMRSHRIYFVFFCLLSLVTVCYLFTLFMASYTTLSLANFISLTLVALLCPSLLRINYKQFIKNTMTIPAIGIVFLQRIFTIETRFETISMGESYAFLPPVIAAVVYIFVYWKDDEQKWFGMVVSAINAVYLIMLLQYGSRGPAMCVILCVAFCVCFSYRKTEGISIVSLKVFVITVICIIGLANFRTIVETISNTLGRMGIRINAINKIIRLQNGLGDISNGRGNIWTITLREIWKSPIWGHGLSTSMHNLRIIYPHNFILQMLYDGGIILTIPIMTWFIRGIIRWIKSCNRDGYAIGATLLFMSVPGALFSGNLWENNRLWFAMAFFILMSINDYALQSECAMFNKKAKHFAYYLKESEFH